MVTKKTKYFCEVCGKEYDAFENALECESKPKMMLYPRGMIYQSTLRPKEILAVRVCDYSKGHGIKGEAFICQEVFGNTKPFVDKWFAILNPLDKSNANPDLGTKEADEMIRFLNAWDIVVTVWDGEKPIPLSVYLAERKMKGGA